MDIYQINSLKSLLENNTYPGRGIVIGKNWWRRANTTIKTSNSRYRMHAR